MPSFLITGSSRGLGLAFVTELLKNPENKIIATARSTRTSKGLQDLAAQHTTDGRLVLLDLDVTDQRSIDTAAADVTLILPDGLDNLISNAGVNDQALVGFEDVNIDEFRQEIDFNLTATIRLLRAFLPIIRRGKKGGPRKIMQLSSVLGSIEIAASSPGLASTYSVGKAALNMLIRKWGASLKQEDIITFVIHPGWVGATEVGSAIAPYIEKYAPNLPNIPVEESAAGVIKVLGDAAIDDAGAFFNFDGTKLPW
ncbi:putative short-chain dehydrogenases/reductase [Bombardia bombarda]|uniref:Short-chain dehydrogenases/reductase n=1 Tax=Bombardia bombarda TaxID=252184 RepID=A0AA39X9A4_9PEZI|nr:putative short-chain dehydrogenases/reductase [Bombardia bombarda]